MWRSEILLVATRVDPTRVSGGQLSLPGVSRYKPTYDVMGPAVNMVRVDKDAPISNQEDTGFRGLNGGEQ